ncbi:MAG: orotidine-5'-phosphate decarboxylase [Candidatus Curtissbacteria bacterium]|nr:orotidine-5'-phosphate decarboxylase [Candidatus Curtissbacteria bacterium]
MNFQQKLDRAVQANNSLLCVGLDPDPLKFKEKISLFAFNKKIIDTTADLVCCYKPQFAFYSAQGIQGIQDLQKTIQYIKRRHPHLPIILDAKRGDIGSTSEMYAKEVFDFLKVDAVTVNPYLGEDSLTPFLQRRDKGIIVLARTSNPGAGDFQDLKVGNDPLYIKVAKKVTSWDKKYHNLLMVVGATWPAQLKEIRKVAPKMTFLVPGMGTQGGDLKKALQNGLTKDKKGLIINSSSGIIYANDPRISAQTLRDEINNYRL